MASSRRDRLSTWRGPAAALGAALLAVAPGPARAQDVLSCATAGAIAERNWGLPHGLLGAIGKVESGRYNPALGGVAAWPWTINAAGQGFQFADRDAAIQAVWQLQAQGVRSIDVGCFQINLVHHPRAFATLAQGFDPQANADYAARFLSELQARTGSWEGAVGAYHSGTPDLAHDYRAKVYAVWAGRSLPAAAPPAGPVMIPMTFPPVAVAAAPPPPTLPPPQPGLPKVNSAAVVWNVAAQANGVRVWTAAPPAQHPSPQRHAKARMTTLAAR
jgi:hypothetical protein